MMVQHTGDWFECKPLDLGQWFACIGMGFISLPLGLVLHSISIENAPNWIAFCREDSTEQVDGQHSAAGSFGSPPLLVCWRSSASLRPQESAAV